MDFLPEISKILENTIYMVSFGGGKDSEIRRNRIRKVEDGGRIYFQEERLVGKKAYHKNLEAGELAEYISTLLKESFKNAVIFSQKADFHLKRSKKGKLMVSKNNPTMAEADTGHDLGKNYIIPEGKPVGSLIALGIMDDEGRVFKKSYSKFRQINRFLELIDDEKNAFFDRDRISVSDLGCGKGYLTFAIHHYFTEILDMKTDIKGMDLKADVIEKLNGIKDNLGLEGISFETGDIAGAEIDNPDIVVALHACDTATDLALSKAVKAGTKLIMAVPCCQHELFSRLSNESLEPILKYGIMKDKFTELATNALRGLALEASGYKVDMIEFTSLEHTMKNILIRARKKSDENPGKAREFNEFSESLGADSSSGMILPG